MTTTIKLGKSAYTPNENWRVEYLYKEEDDTSEHGAPDWIRRTLTTAIPALTVEQYRAVSRELLRERLEWMRPLISARSVTFAPVRRPTYEDVHGALAVVAGVLGRELRHTFEQEGK
jgi:hypothetical protein